MSKRVLLLAVSLMAVAMLAACGGKSKIRVGNFTLISTRNVELSKVANAQHQLKARGVTGKYLVKRREFQKTAHSGISFAVEDAINKAAGDLMVNCVIYRIKEGGKRGYLVIGDVMETNQNKQE